MTDGEVNGVLILSNTNLDLLLSLHLLLSVPLRLATQLMHVFLPAQNLRSKDDSMQSSGHAQ